MTVQAILAKEKPITILDQFLEVFRDVYKLDYKSILNLKFELDITRSSNAQKIDPKIIVARPEHAKEITNLFKEIYKGTYPYKRMEDEDEVRKLLKSKNDDWFLFTVAGQIIGCIGAHYSLNEKKGKLYGLVIKKVFQSFIDMIKTFVGVFIYVCKKYEGKILIWHGEARTNDTASQFGTSLFGMKPIAFFPNKDLFFHKIESDVMIIAYFNDVLRNFRCNKEPRIIRQVLNSYLYSTERYRLGPPIVENPEDISDLIIPIKKEKEVLIRYKEDKIGNRDFYLSLKGSKASLKFFYNPYSKNIENTKYNVQNINELHKLIKELKSIMKKLEIQYCECFVSAYDPQHQKLFYNMGFKPTGYVPSYFYNKKNKLFEDQVVFCLYSGPIDIAPKLIRETENLIKTLELKEEFLQI